jgi:hypothetical protein
MIGVAVADVWATVASLDAVAQGGSLPPNFLVIGSDSDGPSVASWRWVWETGPREGNLSGRCFVGCE